MAAFGKQAFQLLGIWTKKQKPLAPEEIKRRRWEQRIIHRISERQREKAQIASTIKKTNLEKYIPATIEKTQGLAVLKDLHAWAISFDDIIGHIVESLKLSPAKSRITRNLGAHILRLTYFSIAVEQGDKIKVKDAKIIFNNLINHCTRIEMVPKQYRHKFDLKKIVAIREASKGILAVLNKRKESDPYPIDPKAIEVASEIAHTELEYYLGGKAKVFFALLDKAEEVNVKELLKKQPP